MFPSTSCAIRELSRRLQQALYGRLLSSRKKLRGETQEMRFPNWGGESACSLLVPSVRICPVLICTVSGFGNIGVEMAKSLLDDVSKKLAVVQLEERRKTD